MIKNIPTKELADFLGKTAGFVSQIKSGKVKLPAKYCIAISEYFAIPLHELRPDIYPETYQNTDTDTYQRRQVADRRSA